MPSIALYVNNILAFIYEIKYSLKSRRVTDIACFQMKLIMTGIADNGPLGIEDSIDPDMITMAALNIG